MRKTSIYCADFETRASAQAKEEGLTWVWAWAMCNITDIENVDIGNSIDTFMSQTMRRGSTYIYFHNLKFDGQFIISWLLRHGYEWVDKMEKKRERCQPMTFTGLISDSGIFYTIRVCHNTNSLVEFRDSMKKVPFSVDNIAKSFKTKYQKLDLDYVLDRPEGYIMEPDEEEYVKNDVRIIAEVISKLYDDGLKEMTIGSDCMKYYKGIVNNHDREMFRKVFPVVDNQEQMFARKSYKGGWCYVNPKYQGIHLKVAGSTYDVNSLYPSMMHSNAYCLPDGAMRQNRYPFGQGQYYRGEPKPTGDYSLYIHHFRANFKLRVGYLPTVQLKGTSRFRDNEYVIDSEGFQELFMTSVDYEIFMRHYAVAEIEHIDGYLYRAGIGFFDTYINKFMADKVNGEGAVRNEAKLYLNNLYGKFAQKVETGNKRPELIDEVVKYKVFEGEDRLPVYTPVGTFITAYSRRFTISHAQHNFDVFCYADTDSIHCVGQPVGLAIDGKKLCHWSHECDWTEAKFLRQKTYIERVDGVFDIKCAGLPSRGKKVLTEALRANGGDLSLFDVGYEIKGCKLVPKTVKGGVILVERDFKLH